MKSAACSQDIPVIDSVDLLVMGGTLAGVVAALRAAEDGQKVFVASSRSFLGEDLCQRLEYWPSEYTVKEGVPLIRDLYDGVNPPTPLQVKMGLEQALLDAGVRFVFLTYPAGVVRNSSDEVCGVVLANRAGRQVVQASVVLDASVEGHVLNQAGHKLSTKVGSQRVVHTTLSLGDGEDAPGICVADRPRGYAGDEESPDWHLSCRTYELTVDTGGGTPAERNRAHAEVVHRTWTKSEFMHQSVLVFADGSHRSPDNLSDCVVETGLIGFFGQQDSAAGLHPYSCNPFLRARWVYDHFLDCSKRFSGRDRSGTRIFCEGSDTLSSGRIVSLAAPLRPGRDVMGHLPISTLDVPVLGEYDVVVAGGGTAGAPAAISAARPGAKVAVIELADSLGGVGTVGQITRYWYGNRVGFTSEIDAGVAKMENNPVFKRGKGAWSSGAKSHWYHEQCYQAGVDLWMQSISLAAWVVGSKVCGVVVAGPYGYGLLKAKCIVDSTGCADIPAAVGAPTRSICSDSVAVQGTGLSGIMPGRDYHNSDHNFSDDTDLVDSTAFFVTSRKKCKGDFDGGQLINSRERRQIVGEFSLEPHDFMYQRRFHDTICVASSNFDTHGFTIHPLFSVKPPHKSRLWVDVPFRCLLPQRIDGVVVTGLGISAHRDVLPVVRMQPDVQNQGYAAGLIAAKSALSDISLREIDIREIQQQLIELGNLPERVLTDVNNFPVCDTELYRAIKEGWDDFSGLSLIFADRDKSIPIIKTFIEESSDPEQRLRYAQILGLWGDPTGKALLEDAIALQSWDDGWNYIGMGQFGMSMSPLDALIVSLGECGDPESWPCILDKIATLEESPDESHCRAIALAVESLYRRHPDFRAGKFMAEAFSIPGISGHTHPNIATVQAAVTEDLCENEVRNLALRELHMARALYRCGDHDGIGRRTLRGYAADMRGHFSQHANAILNENL